MKKLSKMTPEAKRKQIVSMIDGLHEVLDIKEDFKVTKKTKEKDLLAILAGEAALIEPSDKIDKKILAYLEELQIPIGSEDEAETDQIEDEPEDDDLSQLVNDATKLAELKELVAEHKEFKKLRKKVEEFKRVKHMKEVLLALLEPDDEDEPEEEKKGKDKKGKEKKDKDKDKGKDKKSSSKKGERMTDYLDLLIEKGGTFKAICKKAQAEGDKRGLAQKWAKGAVLSHIKFREGQQKNWLKKKGMKIGENGIVPK